MRLSLCVATCAAALLLPTTLRADTLTEQLVMTASASEGTVEDFGGIAEFDPALGTLNSVTQTLQANFTFTPLGPGPSSYAFNVNGPSSPIQTLITGDTSQNLDFSVTSGPTLEEQTDQFGQQYVIEPFDISTTNGVITYLGPVEGPYTVVDSFTFNYTPAPTPEPSSLVLLGTGLVAVTGIARRRRPTD